MAENYDKDKFKRIWPEIYIPRDTVLSKFADAKHGGNQVKALAEIRARFEAQDAALLADLEAEIAPIYDEWKTNQAAAAAAQEGPGKKGKGKGKDATEASAAPASTEEVVGEGEGAGEQGGAEGTGEAAVGGEGAPIEE